MTIKEVYERYKHLDTLIGDEQVSVKSKDRLIFIFWSAIKKENEQQNGIKGETGMRVHELTQSFGEKYCSCCGAKQALYLCSECQAWYCFYCSKNFWGGLHESK